eukprot:2515473-Pyramimonas_sp.AAC.1
MAEFERRIEERFAAVEAATDRLHRTTADLINGASVWESRIADLEASAARQRLVVDAVGTLRSDVDEHTAELHQVKQHLQYTIDRLDSTDGLAATNSEVLRAHETAILE